MADIVIDTTVASGYGRGWKGIVWINATTAYHFYNEVSPDLVYEKTTDGGETWGGQTVVQTGGDSRHWDIWFDKWTNGDTGSKIHIVASQSGGVRYYNLNTSSDTLSTVVGIETFSPSQGSPGTAPHGSYQITITKAIGGNLLCAFNLADAAFPYRNTYKSTNGGTSFSSIADVSEADDQIDRLIFVPGGDADNQDIWCLYYDVSADELDLKVYDDSANTWGTTNIATGYDTNALTQTMSMSAAPRHSDDHVLLAIATDFAGAGTDIATWDINGAGSITAKTDVVTNFGITHGVAIMINQQNDDVYVGYGGGGGSDTLGATNVRFRKSTDGMGTWGTATVYQEGAADNYQEVFSSISVGDTGGAFQLSWIERDANEVRTNFVNQVAIADITVALLAGGNIISKLIELGYI